jgi:NAD(P)-dependent dehydrogenase (short-subunit alcohol dehydrogenase family)
MSSPCKTEPQTQEHGNLIPIQGSTTSHADLQRAVDQITNETGYIDLLINNAGQTTFDSSPNARPKPTPESSAAEVRDYYFNYRPYEVWTQTLDTNAAAVFATSMAFLELLVEGNKRREKGKGKPSSQIIAIGSVGGLTRFTDSFIYNASKAAVHHLMKNLGAHFVPFDVRCNVIAPGCEFVLLFLSSLNTTETHR